MQKVFKRLEELDVRPVPKTSENAAGQQEDPLIARIIRRADELRRQWADGLPTVEAEPTKPTQSVKVPPQPAVEVGKLRAGPVAVTGANHALPALRSEPVSKNVGTPSKPMSTPTPSAAAERSRSGMDPLTACIAHKLPVQFKTCRVCGDKMEFYISKKGPTTRCPRCGDPLVLPAQLVTDALTELGVCCPECNGSLEATDGNMKVHLRCLSRNHPVSFDIIKAVLRKNENK